MSKESRPAVLGLIGNTPLVQVTRFDTGPCTLFLKLESQNPGGSIKDRIGLAMIDAAERDGRLQPGGTIVEATAGNTGLGLALVGRAKGYRVVLVVPDKMSTEKVLHLKAMGAEVHITRSDVGKVPSRLYCAITEPTGSARTISRSGCTRLKKRLSPVSVPADPTPTTMASRSCSVCAQISGAVLHSWASGLAGLLNWSAKNAPGMSLAKRAATSW